jgi:predicted phosphodiesterase
VFNDITIFVLNMKIGIFQDVHANLPALKKAVEVFRENGCDTIFHVGDLIGIGPYPGESLEFALSVHEMEFIMGNHDYLYPFGIPNPRPGLMSEEEEQHQIWTHQEIGGRYKNDVATWPFVKEMHLSNNRQITFQHYGLDQQTNWFKNYIPNPGPTDLDELFGDTSSEILFYGHNHVPGDIVGRCRYVNLGSAGCFDKSVVRLGILEVTEHKMELVKHAVGYDDNGLMAAFEKRNVPGRAYIMEHFITRR